MLLACLLGERGGLKLLMRSHLLSLPRSQLSSVKLRSSNPVLITSQAVFLCTGFLPPTTYTLHPVSGRELQSVGATSGSVMELS